MILLKSQIYTVSKILKKTKAKMFTDLNIGDKIIFSIPIKRAGIGSRGNSYTSYITITNLNTDDTTQESFNQIGNRLDCFELV